MTHFAAGFLPRSGQSPLSAQPRGPGAEHGRSANPQARSCGQNQEHYSVLENGVIVGRIFLVSNGPWNKLWMWASGHNCDIRRAAYGYEATREAAMAAFAKSWRRQ
jgi:hypothetical protein